MKVKFTLHRAAGPVDLVATVDSATTVGEIAGYLAASDPTRSGRSPDADATLTLAGAAPVSIDPRLPVVDSGLHSGAGVSIGRSGHSYSDPQRATAAVLRVLDGPDAGREFQLPSGASIIGRERGCEVRLSDPLVSRRHARINVTDVAEIIDLGSANGVQIDDIAVPRAILRSADAVRIGDTRLSIRRLTTPAHEPAPQGAAVEFVRSPRLDPVYQGQVFEAPEPPERPRPQRFPLIALAAPILMGGLLYLITRSLTSIVFVALSPLMLIGSALESRLAGRSEYKKAVKEFWADVDGLVADLGEAIDDEATRRNAEHPDTAACLDAARNHAPLLWTRRPTQRGFCEVRLGRGRLASRNEIKLPSAKRATRAMYKRLLGKLAPFAAVDGVPVIAPLIESALGVGGPRVNSLPVARALLAQVVVLHSPAEVVIAAVASKNTAADWDWLKWLPHTSSPNTPLSARHLTSSPTTGLALVADLEDLLTRRAEGGSSETSAPAVVVLVESDAPVQHSRLAGLAADGAAHGIHLIWLADEVTALPAACETYVEIARDGLTGTAGFVHSGAAIAPLSLEQLDAEAAATLARQLARIVDIDARLDDASDLPRAVSLLALNGTELASSPHAVLERWSENRSIVSGPFAPSTPIKHAGSLRAVIGQSAGEAHALDLRTDGPHALVGGTTGAGKSELLQSWILAMAAAHSPQRLTFLLVDYKGGSAFRDCVDLPHTVGLVTDLSQHLVRRALTSLSAELKYREHVLALHAAKDLVTLERQGVLEAPPSLVIVVDEFAALVSEVPEFVDGVVNVAQRGRSLGLHLILATQRPTGVIKDNLRANTNLRLALRMADEADSSDVLGSPAAAFFDPALPGRAVSKTGPGRLVPFQTGYAGGWTSEEPPPPDIRVEELAFGAQAVWEPPEPEDVAPVDPGPTDIRRLVDSISAASALAEIAPPRKPWLPELRAVYDLSDQEQLRSRRTDTELVFGIRDDPDNQAQPTVAFHPDRDGNLAVYGTGGSGKSALLRTLAIAAGFTVRGGPCHVYGIDFGARGLSMIEELPHVGSIIDGADHERITRLIGWLRNLIDERALRYSRVNAGTITDFRRLAAEPDEPRILLLIDGVAAFRQAYETVDRLRWFELFASVVADGRPVGVHVVLSSEQRSGMPPSLAASVQARLVLRLASTDDYSVLGVPIDVLGPTSPPGRGLLGDDEVQVAVLGGSTDVVTQAAAVRTFAASMRKAGSAVAEPIGALPERVDLTTLPVSVDGCPVVGLGSARLEPVGVQPRGTFVIAGPPGSGRTQALHTLVTALRRHDPSRRMHYFGSRRSSIGALDCWTTRGFGSDVADSASTLAAELATLHPDVPRIVVVVEGIGEFAGGLADSALQEVAKVCLAEDHFFVAEGEASTLSSGFGLLGYAKASRCGLAFQPDQADGSAIFRTNFPRINRAEYPPGRALFVTLGKSEVVQVAVAPVA